jgi:hypothetical protein
MFSVSEAEAAAIRAAYKRGGELAAAVELRRHFPVIADTAQAREFARIIPGWKPLPKLPTALTQRRKGGSGTKKPRQDQGQGLQTPARMTISSSGALKHFTVQITAETHRARRDQKKASLPSSRAALR